HVVTTCDDALVLPICNGADDGTLRQALHCALDGDTVELSQLQCSTISLAAPLVVGTINLTMNGPGTGLTIDACYQFRTLVHNGQPGQTLTIQDLSITGGIYANTDTYGGGGGCIYSSGNVYLNRVNVHDCNASATQIVASGGAIFARGVAELVGSSVTDG